MDWVRFFDIGDEDVGQDEDEDDHDNDDDDDDDEKVGKSPDDVWEAWELARYTSTLSPHT